MDNNFIPYETLFEETIGVSFIDEADLNSSDYQLKKLKQVIGHVAGIFRKHNLNSSLLNTWLQDAQHIADLDKRIGKKDPSTSEINEVNQAMEKFVKSGNAVGNEVYKLKDKNEEDWKIAARQLNRPTLMYMRMGEMQIKKEIAIYKAKGYDTSAAEKTLEDVRDNMDKIKELFAA